MKNEPKRVVIDTNTLISALLKPGSTPDKALRKALTSCEVFVSDETLDELQVVLSRPKFDRYFHLREAARALFLELYRARAILVDIEEHITECSDPKDNKFLSLALAANASILVTGDGRHLLTMNPFRDVRIIKATEFLAEP